jgi:Spy/CpxP family protein refolding chaperone
MKSFRTLFPVLGVVAVLAGCSGTESTNTGVASNAVSATSENATNNTGTEARPGPGRAHFGGPESLVFAALHENINLTAEQRATIEGLVQQGRLAHEHGARPAPDGAKVSELAAAIRSGNVDGSRLAANPNRTGANLMQEHQAKAAQNLATLHDTLTTQQRAALVDAVIAKTSQRPEGRFQGRPEQGPRPMGHLLEGLNLTQAQQDQIKAKLDADRPAPPSEADRAAMKAAMVAKLQSFKADSFDASAFVAPPANAPKMGNPADHMAKEMSAVVSVLTAEQRESLAQKIEQGPSARQ